MSGQPPNPHTQLHRLREWVDGLAQAGCFHQPHHTLSHDEAAAAVAVADRILRDATPPPSSPPRSVVAHLDPTYGHWGGVPVHRDEIPLWEKFGFTADRALEWTAAHLTLEDAPRWHDWGSAAEVAAWKPTGIPVAECAVWAEGAVDPSRAAQWHRRSLGPATPQRAEWLNAFPRLDVQEVSFFMESGETIHGVRNWVYHGISAVQAHTWRAKGYSPAQASAAAGEGLSAFDAPHLAPARAIPGRAWRKVCRFALAHGWELRSVDRGWVERERVAVFHRGERRVSYRFRGKRLAEGWGADRHKTAYNLAAAIDLLLQ